MAAEWAPDMPKRLSHRELQQYREGRDQAMAELARRAGGMGLVIET